MGSNGRRSDKIDEQVNTLKGLEISENFIRLRDLIVNAYSNEICWQSEIESELTIKSATESKMVEMEKNFETRAAEQQKQFEIRLNEEILRISTEKEEFFKQELEKVEKTKEEFFKQELEKIETTHKADLAQSSEEKDNLATQIDTLNETIENLNIEMNSKVTESNQTLVSEN